MRDDSSSHTDVLALLSIVEGSNEHSVMKTLETGATEPVSTKYSQLPEDPYYLSL